MSAALASSALAVPHSRIRELAEQAMRMDAAAQSPAEKVLKLYFGESSAPTPDYIKRAATKALADGYTFYTENAGLPSLRQRLSEYYERHHHAAIDPSSEIVITTSGVQALNVGIRCVLDPGDEAIVLTPAWPNGSSIICMCNATPKQVAQPMRNGRFEIDFDALEAAVTPRTRLLLYTSPSNPLGWTATVEEQDRLLEFGRRHKLWIMADEVYERIYYRADQLGTVAPSIVSRATRDDAVIVVQSFSKAWCMTGWRVGWLISRQDLCARATQLNEFIISHAPSFAQRAAETALVWGEDVMLEMLAGLKANRDFCLAALSQVKGVTVPNPEGAFYLFPKIDGLTDSFGFCKRVLEETRVGLAPGVAFGAGGEGSIRICYASERPILEEAMSRIIPALDTN